MAADKYVLPVGVDMSVEVNPPKKNRNVPRPELTWNQAIYKIMVKYPDKTKDWAEGYLQRAYDNSDFANYRDLLSAEFGIEDDV